MDTMLSFDGGSFAMRGLILAGGKSSRFGQDKALVQYDGITFLERAANLLNSLNLKPVIITRQGNKYSIPKSILIYDKLPGQGPLGGIYTAMTIFQKTTFLVLTCDMPLMTASPLLDLISRHAQDQEITLFSVRHQWQPFPGVYSPAIIDRLRQQLLKNDLSMHALLKKSFKKKIIVWSNDPAEFSNVNQKEDLDKRPSFSLTSAC